MAKAMARRVSVGELFETQVIQRGMHGKTPAVARNVPANLAPEELASANIR